TVARAELPRDVGPQPPADPDGAGAGDEGFDGVDVEELETLDGIADLDRRGRGAEEEGIEVSALVEAKIAWQVRDGDIEGLVDPERVDARLQCGLESEVHLDEAPLRGPERAKLDRRRERSDEIPSKGDARPGAEREHRADHQRRSRWNEARVEANRR